MNRFLSFIIIIVFLASLFPNFLWAKENIVKQDTDKDGRADVWEEYDRAEALVKRSKDLNFDGAPDIVKTNLPEAGASSDRPEVQKTGR